MKKIIIMLSIVLFALSSKAQLDYQTVYDYEEPFLNSSSSGDAVVLADAESYTLRSFIRMYKATLDVNYLHKFIAHARVVITKRGLNRTDGKKCFARTDASPGWASVYDNGMITFPLVEFAYLINVEYTALGSTSLASSITYDGNTYTTFGAFADFLETFCSEVVDVFHESNATYNDANNIDYWYTVSGTSGYYYPDAQTTATTLIANNMQCAMALTLSKLHQLVGTADYLTKTRITANRFKSILSLVGNHYEWHHRWSEPDPTINWEDTDHGAIEIELANHCYKNSIKVSGTMGAPVIFNATDIGRFARSVTESAYQTPTQINYTVHGDNDWYDDGPVHALYREAAGQWMPLSESLDGNIDYLGRDLFHINAYMFFHRYPIDATHSPVRLLNLAYLEYYKSIGYSRLNYVDEDLTYGASSNWAGVAVGSFNGTDKHIISVRNYDGDFFLSKMVSGQINYLTSYTAPGSSSNWKGVAAGDFDNDGTDEFVALRNYDGDIFMYKYTSGAISTFKTYDAGSASNWAGIAAGDFDGNGTDEFIGIRNYDASLMLFAYESGNITYKGNYIGTTGSNWAGIAAGDFDADGKDEIAAVRNLDGKIYIFEVVSGVITLVTSYTPPNAVVWDGICAGSFSGTSNEEFVAHRSDNGDYYFFTLESGSVVFKHHEYYTGGQVLKNFAAGKLISTTKDDFVYLRNVDGGMVACTVDAISTANTTGQSFKSTVFEENLVAPGSEQLNNETEINDISIFPNPANTELSIFSADQTISKVEFFDVSGKKVYSLENYQGTFNISFLQPGLYIVSINLGTQKVVKRLIKQ